MSLQVGQCLKDVYLIHQKIDYYRGRDCIAKMCKRLKEHAMKIINHKEKEMMPLTDEENKFYEEQEACNICEGKFCTDENDEN